MALMSACLQRRRRFSEGITPTLGPIPLGLQRTIFVQTENADIPVQPVDLDVEMEALCRDFLKADLQSCCTSASSVGQEIPKDP